MAAQVPLRLQREGADIGVYPEVSLTEARELASKAKAQLRKDEDPGLIRKLQKREKLLVAENHFEAIALEWWVQQKGR